MTELHEGILVADAHRLIRAGLMSMISGELGISEVVGVDDFGGALAALAREPTIKFLLLDMGLPGMGGIEGLRSIRLQRPDLRVVAMVWHPDRAEAFDVLAAGVHGYLPKDLLPTEIIQAVQTVLDGRIYVPPIICDLSLHDPVSPGENPDQDHPELTIRQREVLTHLANGLSNKEIARALNIAEGTVKVHVTAAFRTLHVHNRVGAASALLKLKASAPNPQGDLPGIPPPSPPKGHRGGQFAFASLPLIVDYLWLADAGLFGALT